MIGFWTQELALQRHQELLARADRYRSDRMIVGSNTHRRTLSYWLKSLLGWAFGDRDDRVVITRRTWSTR